MYLHMKVIRSTINIEVSGDPCVDLRSSASTRQDHDWRAVPLLSEDLWRKSPCHVESPASKKRFSNRGAKSVALKGPTSELFDSLRA